MNNGCQLCRQVGGPTAAAAATANAGAGVPRAYATAAAAPSSHALGPCPCFQAAGVGQAGEGGVTEVRDREEVVVLRLRLLVLLVLLLEGGWHGLRCYCHGAGCPGTAQALTGWYRHDRGWSIPTGLGWAGLLWGGLKSVYHGWQGREGGKAALHLLRVR